MKERAISPIIATVILVAVTIALAVGVALWFSGIIGGAGKIEQLQI
ncbi:MAG: archaellin/type IV pilin N-terminal domain-containing protein, partial [Fervidicoccaceae archaeon]